MVTDGNQSSNSSNQHLTFDDITRRVFMGSSAVAAGTLTLPGITAGQSASNSTSDQSNGLSTTDILQLSLDLVGADEVPADTGIYVEGTEIETALVGIDIASPEIQLANEAGYDLALAHHPLGGWPIANIAKLIFNRGVELMVNQGVPEERAKEALNAKYKNWVLNGNATNYRHDPSIAKLLDQPAMNIHQPVDELSRRAFVEVVNDLSSDATVADLKTALYEALPEARVAKPDIITALGRDRNEIGDVAVYHAAGTDGGEPVARAFYENGIDTIIYIHVEPNVVQSLNETYGDDRNLISTGHVVGDGVGFRMLCLALEAHGVDVTPISGADIANEVADDDVGGGDGPLDVGNQVSDVLENPPGEDE